jgi:hypothetical protein
LIKLAGLKITGLMLATGAVILIVAIVGFVTGCKHDPRTIRIDNAGVKGFDSPKELTDSQKQRIVELILDTPEAKEQPPTESIFRVGLMWAAIVWDNSHYSYLYSFGFENVEADPAYQTVPESAGWYPGATIYFGDPQTQSIEWVIQSYVDLNADKVVYVNNLPYSGEPFFPPAPESS